MSRSISSPASRAKRRKVLSRASGFVGRSSKCYKIALRRVEKGMQYSYMHRKNKKRDFRSLWIVRLNAFARENGLKYSILVDKLEKANFIINRKILAQLAYSNPGELKNMLLQSGVLI